jgi:hypothetical protein
MRIESLPVSLPARALGALLLVFTLVGLGLLLLAVGDVIGASMAPGGDVRLAPFRWEPGGVGLA